MSDISIPPFELGQKVVALKTAGNDRGNSIVKGSIYMIEACKQLCKCGYWMVDIGMKHDGGGYGCCECGNRLPANHTLTAVWISNTFFAPINPYSNSVSHELAIEAMKERVEVDVPVRVLENN